MPAAAAAGFAGERLGTSGWRGASLAGEMSPVPAKSDGSHPGRSGQPAWHRPNSNDKYGRTIQTRRHSNSPHLRLAAMSATAMRRRRPLLTARRRLSCLKAGGDRLIASAKFPSRSANCAVSCHRSLKIGPGSVYSPVEEVRSPPHRGQCPENERHGSRVRTRRPVRRG